MTKKREVANLGKIGEARLDLIPTVDECNPGIAPVEYNVVIAPARMAEKIGSIFIPDEAKESEGLAMQVGRIIAQSPLAYSYEKWPAGTEHLKPQIGQLVWFARYGGALFTGIDGNDYRILKDKDIGAVVVEPEPENQQLELATGDHSDVGSIIRNLNKSFQEGDTYAQSRP